MVTVIAVAGCKRICDGAGVAFRQELADNTDPRDMRGDAEVAKERRRQARDVMVIAQEDTTEIGDRQPALTVRQEQIRR